MKTHSQDNGEKLDCHFYMILLYEMIIVLIDNRIETLLIRLVETKSDTLLKCNH